MGELAAVEDYVTALRRTFTMADLKRRMADMSGEMGFQHFSMTHHVDLRLRSSSENVALTNYPPDFVQSYLGDGMHRIDPVVAASCYIATGFRWSEMDRIIRLRKPQLAVFDLSRRTGLGEGYAVPVHLPGEANGACVFVTAAGRNFPKNRDMMAQLVGRYSFDTARRIIRHREKLPLPGSDRTLTDRQVDCVLLVARGLSNEEIAARLGLRVTTVIAYLDAARRRYGARNRTQLAMRAVFDGAFTLSDVLR